MENKIIEKIQKLLRLSGSNEQGEAEAAMKFAQELAIKYDIDISNISLEQKETKQEFIKAESHEGQRFRVAQKFVNQIIQKHFGVSIVLGGNRTFGRKLYFIGRKDKAEFAKWVNEYLNNTFMNLWRNYQLKYCINTKQRDTFLYGLQMGLEQKLNENKAKVEEEYVQNKDKYALTLVDEKKQLQLAVTSLFNNLRSGPKVKYNWSGTNATLEAGKAQGYKINIIAGELA